MLYEVITSANVVYEPIAELFRETDRQLRACGGREHPCELDDIRNGRGGTPAGGRGGRRGVPEDRGARRDELGGARQRGLEGPLPRNRSRSLGRFRDEAA